MSDYNYREEKDKQLAAKNVGNEYKYNYYKYIKPLKDEADRKAKILKRKYKNDPNKKLFSVPKFILTFLLFGGLVFVYICCFVDVPRDHGFHLVASIIFIPLILASLYGIYHFAYCTKDRLELNKQLEEIYAEYKAVSNYYSNSLFKDISKIDQNDKDFIYKAKYMRINSSHVMDKELDWIKMKMEHENVDNKFIKVVLIVVAGVILFFILKSFKAF